MKTLRIILLAAAGLVFATPLVAQDGDLNLDQLLEKVQGARDVAEAKNKEREQRFLQARNQQRALLRKAQSDLAAAERKSDGLKANFAENEKALEELSETLRINFGNVGELIGVVRQVAGDTKGVVDNSLVTSQFPDRGAIASELAQIKGLPSMEDLDRLRILLFEEMVKSGQVSRFVTNVVTEDGVEEPAEVMRVGVFNTIMADKFLRFEPETRSLQVLARQPQSRFRSLAGGLYDSNGGIVAMAVDPSRGSLLEAFIQSPTFMERIDQGGLVGYLIIVLGLIGLLIATERFLSLTRQGTKIHSQLKAEAPNTANALGRILSVYHNNQYIDTETLELKLDEAILKETPQLEKRQGFIKVLAAVAPLLGLLGTVVGMIATFQAITLFGAGDPKLMAGGISQALITTVLGLCVAIPLVLLHSIVASKSKGLIEILEEQSAGMIARHSEADRTT